ncbi:hypothetical protein E3N88_29040 [Mikania micrantha]|uniref:Reverse transcriptase Ty1/copia-type domain-containing protein n=1 Tax=Mikania micrantha TaxID=192012 RepID=A0A5N6N189_9ASTR|nr:hypothetical protein E3N88_29040 [Mikania micrantha]
MIASLMYLTASRPDIMFATCLCACYQSKPRVSNLIAVKRIMRYLKGTPDLGLWYPNDDKFKLTAYSDSDYGGCKRDFRSTSAGFDAHKSSGYSNNSGTMGYIFLTILFMLIILPP